MRVCDVIRAIQNQNICLYCYFIVSLLNQNLPRMAMTINSSPILEGESARLFIEEAEINGKHATPRRTEEREAELREIETRSRKLLSMILGRKNG